MLAVNNRFNSPILRCENISLHFGGVSALVEVSFEVNRGEILSIIGPNGAGKTCVINVISGFYRASKGRYILRNETSRTLLLIKSVNLVLLGLSRTLNYSLD